MLPDALYGKQTFSYSKNVYKNYFLQWFSGLKRKPFSPGILYEKHNFMTLYLQEYFLIFTKLIKYILTLYHANYR